MKPRILSTDRLSFRLATAIAALLTVQFASALDGIWLGSSGDWNDAGTWSGGTIADGIGATANFTGADITADATITLAADRTIGNLTFTDATTSSHNLLITGANLLTLDVDSGSPVINVTQSDRTLSINSVIAGTEGLQKTGLGALTLNGSIANPFTGGLNVNGGTLTLDSNNLTTPTNLVNPGNVLRINNGALTISGQNLAAATTVQTFASTTIGAGINTLNIAKGTAATSATLNLGALTTTAGSITTINPTTIWATGTPSTTEKIFVSSINGNALPGSGKVNVNAGLFYRQSAIAGAARWVSVDSAGQLQALPATLGTLTASTAPDPVNGYQISTANITLTNTSMAIYGLVLNGNANPRTLTLANNGTLTLNGILGVQGTNVTNIAPGTGTSNLIVGPERNLVINLDNSAGLSISAPIANNSGGASGVTIASTAPSGTTPGEVTFGGASTYTGSTNITRGTLSFTAASPFGTTPGTNGSSGISIHAGSVLSSARTGTNPSTTIAAPLTLVAGGNSTLRIGQGAASSTHTFNVNGAIGGTTNNLVFTTTTGSFNNGSSVFVLGAPGTYTGNTIITTGNGSNNPVTVRAGTGVVNALPATTVLTFGQSAGTGSGRSLTYDLNGNNQTLAGLNYALALPDDRNIRVTSATDATLTIHNTANFSFGGSTKDSDVAPAASPGSITSAQITGPISLTKSGTGTFTLGGILTNGATAPGNAFTGTTQILGGILVLGETLSIQNSTLNTQGSIPGNATNGLRTTVSTLRTGGISGDKNLADIFTTTSGGYDGLTALTLNIAGSDVRTYAADLGDGAGNLSLTKVGTGTQVFTAAQTYTGNTTGTAGVLLTTQAAALPGYNVPGKVIFNGGTIAVQLGVGAWSASEVEALVTNATKSSGFLGIDTTAGSLLQSGSFTAGTFGSSLGLNKLGANDLTLDQANTFTGSTTVTAGTLTLAHANALQSSSLITTGAGTISLGSGTILNLGGLSGATGNLATIISNYNTVTAIHLNTPATVPGSALSYGGVISDGVLGTTLTKSGVGVQALSGANTYTGATQIDGGILVFRNKAAKASAPVTAAAAGSIGLGVKDADAAFYSAVEVGDLFNTNSLSGFVLDSASGVAIDTTIASFDQSVALTAARSLTKLGTNVLTLSQVNTYSGATQVMAGTLSLTGSLDGGGAISTIGSGAFSQTSTGVISSAATFTHGSTGTSTLAGTNTYTGPTQVNLGQLTISSAGALGSTVGNTSVAAGGRLTIATADLSVAEPLNITGTGTTATNGVIAFGGGFTGMTLSGPITLGGAARIQADGNTGSILSGGISLGANPLTLNTDGGATQTITTTAITGTGGSLVKSGSGTLVLAAANTYTGATTVNLGTLSITDNHALGTAEGATTINGGNGTNAVILSLSNATSDLTLAEPLNFPGNTVGRSQLSNNSAQHHTLSGPVDVTSDTNVAQFDSDGSGSITVSGDITGTMTNGASLFLRGTSTSANNRVTGNLNIVGNLFKTDAGTWLVGAPGKTYSWTNTGIAVGTLKLGLANLLPPATIVTLGNTTGASSPILDLNGFNQTIGGIAYNGQGTATGTRTITSSTPAVLTVNNATDSITTGTNVSINNIVLTGALSLIKGGAGTLALNGDNTYSGDTVVNDGTLVLADNAQLKFVLGSASGENNDLTGAGTVTLDGDFVIDTAAADALASGSWMLENVSSLAGAYGSTFSVVGFTDIGGDKWEKSVDLTKKYTFDETTGILTLASSASYASWAAVNAIGSTPEQDKDGDGVTNALEYLLGGDVNTDDLDQLPTVDASGANLILTFKRDRNSIDGSTTVAIEVGTTLATWPALYHVGTTTAGSTAGVTVAENTPSGFDTITLTVPKAADTNKFARLKVTVAP